MGDQVFDKAAVPKAVEPASAQTAPMEETMAAEPAPKVLEDVEAAKVAEVVEPTAAPAALAAADNVEASDLGKDAEDTEVSDMRELTPLPELTVESQDARPKPVEALPASGGLFSTC